MFAKFFATRTTGDSVATLTARPSLFNQALFKLKKALKRPAKDEKAALHEEEYNAQHGKAPESQAPAPQDIIAPSTPTEATSSASSYHCASWTGGDCSVPPTPPNAPSQTPSAVTTPSLAPSTATTPPTTPSSGTSAIQSSQVSIHLAAAEKKIAELEATIAQRKLEHAVTYKQNVKKMDLPGAIKKVTWQRDVFRARLEPAKKELALKVWERSRMEEKWFDERERRFVEQLNLLAAKAEIEEGAKAYAELEAKFLKLQSQGDSAHDEVDHEALDSEESAAEACPSQ